MNRGRMGNRRRKLLWRALTCTASESKGNDPPPLRKQKLRNTTANTIIHAQLTVLRKQGKDFPLELELVHGKPRAAEAHGRLQNVDVDRQTNNGPERVPHAIALVVEMLGKTNKTEWNNNSQASGGLFGDEWL